MQASNRIIGNGFFRAFQMLVAMLGIALSASSATPFWLLTAIFCIALIYLLMVAICVLAGRSGLNSAMQLAVEFSIALTLLIYTIFVMTKPDKDIWMISAIVAGYILPVMFFITAFDKN